MVGSKTGYNYTGAVARIVVIWVAGVAGIGTSIGVLVGGCGGSVVVVMSVCHLV